jgi:hypothetical protein
MQNTLYGSFVGSCSKLWYCDGQTQQTDLMATCKGASCVICPHPWKCQKVQNLPLRAAFHHLHRWLTIKSKLHIHTRAMLDKHYFCPALTNILIGMASIQCSCVTCALLYLYWKNTLLRWWGRLTQQPLWRIFIAEFKLISLQVVPHL